MKAFSTIIVILLIAAAILFFTKPSDKECMVKGKAVVDAGELAVTPGYDNPMYQNTKGQTAPENILVKDKFLWKEIEHIDKAEIKTIGYAYLGSFHPVKGEKKQ